MATERESLARRMAQKQTNLQLIEDRMAEYVLSTDVSLQLVKEKAKLEDEIEDLERRLAALPPDDQGQRTNLTPAIPDRAELFRRLVKFTKSNELHDLCLLTHVDTSSFETTPHTTFVRELLLYLERRGEYDRFVQALAEHMPSVLVLDLMPTYPYNKLVQEAGPASMAQIDIVRTRRCADLKARIEEALTLINEYEAQVQLSNDPKDRRRAELELNRLQVNLAHYEKEYDELGC